MSYYEKFKYLNFYEAVPDEKYWWMISRWHNGIFRVEKETYKVECVLDFPNKARYLNENEYRRVMECGEKLLFLPCFSESIAIYDKRKNILIKKTIPHIRNISKVNINNGVIYKEWIYLFCCHAELAPFKINMETYEIVTYEEEWEKIVKKYYTVGNYYFIYSVVANEDCIWMSIDNTSMILKWSLENQEQIEVINLGKGYKVNKLALADDKYLCITLKEYMKCLVYDLKKSCVKREICIKDFESEKSYFTYHVVDDEKVIMFSEDANVLVVADMEDEKYLVLNCNNKDFCEFEMRKCNVRENTIYFKRFYVDKKNIYLFPYVAKGMVIVNRQDMSYQFIELEIDKTKSTEDIMKKYILDNKEEKYYERTCPVDYFLSYVQNGKDITESVEKIGMRVFREVRNGQ